MNSQLTIHARTIFLRRRRRREDLTKQIFEESILSFAVDFL